MNEFIYVFEDVLTPDFIYLCSKSSYLCVQFWVFSCVNLSSEKSLKISVLVSQVFHVFFCLFELLSCLTIHLFSKIQVQIDKFSMFVFELVEPCIDSFFSICQFVVQFLNPFGQDSQNGSIMRFEDGALNFFFSK